MDIFRDIFAVIGLFAILPILIHLGENFGPTWLADACSDFRRFLRWRNGIVAPEPEEHPIMLRYNPDAGNGPHDQQWVRITELVVPTDYDKQQLLAALEYLHDRWDIDTDYIAVNSLVHLYESPDLVVVRG